MLDLEQELKQILGAGRAARISMRLYGFDGRGGTTLRQLASETGLSYERIRQLSTCLIREKAATHPVTPALDRAIEIIAKRAPAPAERFERHLATGAHQRRTFRLEGVINAAKVFGRPVRFSLARSFSGRVVYVPSAVNSMLALKAAKKQVKAWGMARISDVAASIPSSKPVSLDDVASALIESRDDFRWLNRQLGWFWFSQFGRSKVGNRLKKILAVSNPVALREVYAALAKDRRLAWFGPPLSVFAEFCSQIPGVQVDHRVLRATERIDRSQVLSPIEKRLVRAMDRHGAPITWKELVNACGEAGVSKATASVYASTSSLVRKDSRGIYRLVGRPASRSSAAAAQSRKYDAAKTAVVD